jgi:hypothetical protein
MVHSSACFQGYKGHYLFRLLNSPTLLLLPLACRQDRYVPGRNCLSQLADTSSDYKQPQQQFRQPAVIAVLSARLPASAACKQLNPNVLAAQLPCL